MILINLMKNVHQEYKKKTNLNNYLEIKDSVINLKIVKNKVQFPKRLINLNHKKLSNLRN